MKTTIEISDNLLGRTRRLAHRQHRTLRSLMEEGLTRILEDGEGHEAAKPKPITFKGKGLSPEYRDADWRQLRDAAYQGRGA
jgi:predicted transcriptional regulator